MALSKSNRITIGMARLKFFFLRIWILIRRGYFVLINQGVAAFFIKVFQFLTNRQSSYRFYVKRTTLLGGDTEKIQNKIEEFSYKPIISLIIPKQKFTPSELENIINSIKKQIYPFFEIHLVGGNLNSPTLNDVINGAKGEYLSYLDEYCELNEGALYEVVSVLQKEKYDLVYTDEDNINSKGKRKAPFFKPEWSPDLLMSFNYINQLSVYKKKIIEEVGGINGKYSDNPLYDLLLRVTEKTSSIKHIPKILYHKRRPPILREKLDMEALKDAMVRRGIGGEVLVGIPGPGRYRIKYKINEYPLISIIIPFKDNPKLLKKCLDSILLKTTYPNYEMILINHDSRRPETKLYLKHLDDEPRIRIIDYYGAFNHSKMNNIAVQKSKGDVLLLLNNDTEVISPGWLESMLEFAQRKEVGCVGAKLYFACGMVQHYGVVIGMENVAGHAFWGRAWWDNGYFDLGSVIRNVSAVTAACLMIRKDLFKQVGGFDETGFPAGYNDVDFCLRLREKGYVQIVTPYSELYHYESQTRITKKEPPVAELFRDVHSKALEGGDKYYNPNLCHRRFDYKIGIHWQEQQRND